MTDRELRKLGRAALLQLLLAQRRENEALAARLQQAQEELRQRRLCVEKAGSLAQACMQLNGVFEAAQAACEQYMENMAQRMEPTCPAAEVRGVADIYSAEDAHPADGIGRTAQAGAESVSCCAADAYPMEAACLAAAAGQEACP